MYTLPQRACSQAMVSTLNVKAINQSINLPNFSLILGSYKVQRPTTAQLTKSIFIHVITSVFFFFFLAGKPNDENRNQYPHISVGNLGKEASPPLLLLL